MAKKKMSYPLAKEKYSQHLIQALDMAEKNFDEGSYEQAFEQYWMVFNRTYNPEMIAKMLDIHWGANTGLKNKIFNRLKASTGEVCSKVQDVFERYAILTENKLLLEEAGMSGIVKNINKIQRRMIKKYSIKAKSTPKSMQNKLWKNPGGYFLRYPKQKI